MVLMDLVMPNMDGVDATSRIKQQRPETHVIILTSFLDDERVVPAIKAGATSYCSKTSPRPTWRAPSAARAPARPSCIQRSLDGSCCRSPRPASPRPMRC